MVNMLSTSSVDTLLLQAPRAAELLAAGTRASPSEAGICSNCSPPLSIYFKSKDWCCSAREPRMALLPDNSCAFPCFPDISCAGICTAGSTCWQRPQRGHCCLLCTGHRPYSPSHNGSPASRFVAGPGCAGDVLAALAADCCALHIPHYPAFPQASPAPQLRWYEHRSPSLSRWPLLRRRCLGCLGLLLPSCALRLNQGSF